MDAGTTAVEIVIVLGAPVAGWFLIPRLNRRLDSLEKDGQVQGCFWTLFRVRLSFGLPVLLLVMWVIALVGLLQSVFGR